MPCPLTLLTIVQIRYYSARKSYLRSTEQSLTVKSGSYKRTGTRTVSRYEEHPNLILGQHEADRVAILSNNAGNTRCIGG